MRSYKSPKKAVSRDGRKFIRTSPARKNINTFDSDSTDSSESDNDDTSSDDGAMDLTHRRESTANRKNSIPRFSSGEEDDDDDEEDDSSSSEEEGIDYVQLTKNRRKMKDHKFIKGSRSESAEEGEIIEQSDSELDDDLVDQVIEEEEKKLNEVSLNDLDDLDFDLDFNDSSIFDAEDMASASHISKKLEDIGEVVLSSKTSSDKPNIKNNLHVEMKVPKFEDKEIDSEDDYELDKDQLIQTLMADNDDSELQIEGDDDDDDDDFDRLAESRRQYTPGSERDVITGDDEDDISDADSDKLMALETKAMVDDFYENRTRKLLRRGSIYRNGVIIDIDDDLELDRLDNFEEMFPKQQASFRRRSSILDQSLLSSSDDDDGLSKFRSKVKRRKSKKASRRASDIRRMLGPIKDGEYIDAIETDSNDDTNLVLNILNEEDEDSSSVLSDDETDEDFDLPNKTTKRHKGSRHAKEVLSSSSLGFGAPPLGTFTTRKPYSVIDGVSTRFVQPFESPRKAAKLAKRRGLNRITEDQAGDPIPLDELLNIDEFDEDNGIDEEDPFDDPAHDHETNDKLQEMFGEKRIPLTAFRNKGLINKYPQVVEPMNHNNRRKNSANSSQKKKKKVQVVVDTPTPTETGVPDLQEIDEYIISNQGDIQGFAALASDEEDAVSTKIQGGRRKMLRRVSMVEAQREGKRATKGGVFDEGLMENLEAFLVDVGANDEFSFLVGND